MEDAFNYVATVVIRNTQFKIFFDMDWVSRHGENDSTYWVEQVDLESGDLLENEHELDAAMEAAMCDQEALKAVAEYAAA